MNGTSHKENKKASDIDIESSHPPGLIKQIVKNISRQASNLSSAKDPFEKAVPYCNTALERFNVKNSKHYFEPNINK